MIYLRNKLISQSIYSCTSDNDATVELVENIQDHYRWKFDMFKFKYYVTRVNYITCIMTSCETAGECAETTVSFYYLE